VRVGPPPSSQALRRGSLHAPIELLNDTLPFSGEVFRGGAFQVRRVGLDVQLLLQALLLAPSCFSLALPSVFSLTPIGGITSSRPPTSFFLRSFHSTAVGTTVLWRTSVGGHGRVPLH